MSSYSPGKAAINPACQLSRQISQTRTHTSRPAGASASRHAASGAHLSALRASTSPSASCAVSVDHTAARLAHKVVEAVAAFILVAQPLPVLAGEVIQGVPRVADGDTLQIQDKRIRLFGFDAPEKAQLCKNAQGKDYSCGQESGDALQQLIGSSSVRCEVRNTDQYGRNVSSCSVLTNKGPQDIGNYMVSNGYAVAYRQYGQDYVPMEESAHKAHKGIWQGSFQTPADWRKDQKIEKLLASRNNSSAGASSSILAALPAPTPGANNSPSNGCKIKGNINSKGEKIYHVPGGKYYDSTQIDVPQGERWFCNEREAKDAGWRAASQ